MKSLKLRRLLNNKVTVTLLLAILLLVGLRFAILPYSPPGFYIDEAATGAHVISMVEHQTNAHGQAWPFYSQSLGGGFTTPVYLYPLSIWASIFGFSEVALRAFSQVATIGAILFMALGMRLWLSKHAGLIAAIVGLALPWGWLQGSLAWDVVLVPLFIGVAFFGWSLLQNRQTTKARRTGFLLLPIGLILLAYVYPPYWVVAPLLFIAAYLTLLRAKRVNLKQIVYSCIAATILLIPLAFFILSPQSLGRSESISIFHDASILEAIGLFIRNIALLINPFFLFIYGDFNPRHSIGWQGMLGVAALIPFIFLVIVIVKRLRHKKLSTVKHPELYLTAIGIGGFLLSIVGSALTNEGQPQSLRSSGAWPFAIIIVTVGWLWLLRYRAQWLKWLAITVFVLATLAYVIDLRFFYPTRYGWAFDISSRQEIFDGTPTSYPRLALKYYEDR